MDYIIHTFSGRDKIFNGIGRVFASNSATPVGQFALTIGGIWAASNI
ncbi:putative conjugative transfer protein TraG [Orientia chuto str. Dubai]|uniref:Putative conjugative transfer protein TraG n=1 Tax=Orientia chuto str. Dubai TaxID=1359168 RepID=A0A0F3MM27_9RICK|nr:hypothetical protein [Candidatus Orientia mediorientalis]KJV55629.1 putative conjugative transfer protein TraG [Orientia chuto str. Dubai]